MVDNFVHIANLPILTPHREEVLIKMEIASINVVDCKIKQGAMKLVLPYRFSHTPGTWSFQA
jgi:NADPH:quinone reductase-like Zn-dependent oxidoreductase